MRSKLKHLNIKDYEISHKFKKIGAINLQAMKINQKPSCIYESAHGIALYLETFGSNSYYCKFQQAWFKTVHQDMIDRKPLVYEPCDPMQPKMDTQALTSKFNGFIKRSGLSPDFQRLYPPQEQNA